MQTLYYIILKKSALLGLLHFVFLFHSKAATKPTKPTVNVGCTTIKEDCAYEEYTLFGK